MSAPSNVTVRITPTIDRDYVRRGVFPELRIADAPAMAGIAGLFVLTADRAREVLADAEAERLVRTSPPGTPKSYTSLVDALRKDLGMCRRPELIEEAQERQVRAQRWDDRAALKRAAEFDAEATAAEARANDMPGSEEQFRGAAVQALYRAWGAFEVTFLRQSNLMRESGFRFARGTDEVLMGFFHSIVWTVQHDAEVVFDEAIRFEARDKARLKATKLDAPLQRFLAQVKADGPGA